MPANLAALSNSAPQQKKQDEENSLWNNVKGLGNFLNPVKLLPGIVGGIGGDVAGTVKETARVLPTLAAAATGQNANELDKSPLSFLVNTDAIRESQKDQPLADAIMGQINQVAPLVGHAAEGVAQTGINLGDTLAQGVSRVPGISGAVGGPMDISTNPYVQAYNQGNLAPVAIGDLLNVGLAGKGAAAETALNPIPEAAGARLAAAGEGAMRAPFLPYTEAGQAARRFVDRGIQGESVANLQYPRLNAIASTLTRTPGLELQTPQALVPTLDRYATALGNVKGAADVRSQLMHQSAAAVNPATKSGALIDELKLTPEQQAGSYLADSLAIPDSTLALAEKLQAGGQNVGQLGKIASPEAIAEARRIAAGDAEAVARSNQLVSAMAPAEQAGEATFMAGKGMKGQSTVEQRRTLGFADQPLNDLIDKAVNESDIGKQLGTLNDALGSVEDAQGRLAIQSKITDLTRKADEMRAKLAENPDYAPANYRPALKIGQDVQNRALQYVDELRKQGNESMASEIEAMANDVATKLTDMTQQGDLGQQIGKAPRHVIGSSETMQNLGATPRQSLGVKALGSEKMKQGTFADLSAKGQYNAILERMHTDALNQGKRQIIEQFGQADKAGVRGWREINPETGAAAKGGGTFVPDYVYKAMEAVSSPKTTNAFLKAYDKGMATVKLSWLPLSPKWQVGNVGGNAFMAGLGSGVDPIWLAKNFDEIRELRKNPDAYASQVMGKGFTDEIKRDANIAGGKIAKASDFMFKINQTIDDMSHIASYLKEKEGALKRGMTDQAASEYGVNRALKVMGDFQNMSKFERDAIRRIVPFYPWYKHITKLALNLPIDNPARLAWTLHLADQFDPNKGTTDLPEYLQGAIPMGKDEKGQPKYLRVPWNPFMGGTTDSPLLNPANAAGGLSPFIQWPLAMATGWNPGTGKMITKAPTPGRAADEAGPLTLSQDLGYLINQFPQLRMAADLKDRAGRTEPAALLNTREPLVANKKVVPRTTQDIGPVPAEIAQFLTGASVDQPDLADQAKRAKKSTKAKEKAAKQYQRAVTRGG